MATEKQVAYISNLMKEVNEEPVAAVITALDNGAIQVEIARLAKKKGEQLAATPAAKPVNGSIEQRQLDILKGMAIKRAAEDSENVAWIITNPSKFLDTCTALYATYRATLQGLKEADNQKSVPI